MTAPAVAPSRPRAELAIAVAAMATVPACVLRFGPLAPTPVVQAMLFGLGVVGAAFMLTWAAEVVQLDISAGLALALLALVAVLPEYAVDFVFTWKAGKNPAEYAPDALANMTGGNQLLIGVGWSLVVLIAAWRMRVRRNARASVDGADAEDVAVHEDPREVELSRSHAVAIAFLVLASVYGLTLPLHRTLTLIDTLLLVAIFAWYISRVARAPAETPHLVGPAAQSVRLQREIAASSSSCCFSARSPRSSSARSPSRNRSCTPANSSTSTTSS